MDQYMEYEINKYKRLLLLKEAGIAKELSETLSLDFQAIRELVKHLDEAEQARFNRRLDRIDKYLKEFGGQNHDSI